MIETANTGGLKKFVYYEQPKLKIDKNILEARRLLNNFYEKRQQEKRLLEREFKPEPFKTTSKLKENKTLLVKTIKKLNKKTARKEKSFLAKIKSWLNEND